MDPEKLEEAIIACMEGRLSEHGTHPLLKELGPKKPKAILPVHLYGMPAQMEAIMEIAEKYDIPVLEYAAEALGSHIGGKQCGTFGALGVYSFNGNKIITTSSGGALVSGQKDLIELSRKLSTQAREAAIHYEHTMVGFNYRLSNVLAGIGIGQMKVLDERISLRRENFDFYKSLLKDIPGISLLEEPEGYFSNRWLSTIYFQKEYYPADTKDKLMIHLQRLNIETRPLWKPMHIQPVFRTYPYIGADVAEDLFDRGLCLPSGSNLDASDRQRIQEGLLSFFQ